MKINGVSDCGNGISFDGADVSGNYMVTMGMHYNSANPDTQMVGLQDGFLSQGMAQTMSAQKQFDYAEPSQAGRLATRDMRRPENAEVMDNSSRMLQRFKEEDSGYDPNLNPTQRVQQAASNGRDTAEIGNAFSAPLEVVQSAPQCCVDDTGGVNLRA